jgi:hypothetical protein
MGGFMVPVQGLIAVSRHQRRQAYTPERMIRLIRSN